MTIERVAKALRSKAAEIENRQDGGDADAMWFADEFARAALEAIAEPTPEMIEAGAQAMSDLDGERPASWEDFVLVAWRVMHTAMMKERS